MGPEFEFGETELTCYLCIIKNLAVSYFLQNVCLEFFIDIMYEVDQ